MERPDEFGQRACRVRFLGSEPRAGHGSWYRTIAEYYDGMYRAGFSQMGREDLDRPTLAAEFLHDLFGRQGHVTRVLDVACGTFSIDLHLMEKGYRVVGCDLSPHMLAVARRNLRETGRRAKLLQADMKDLDLGQQFDAVLCLGTAFNYLHIQEDWQQALQRFGQHLGPDGILVLDLTNFAPWIDKPTNARAEMDYRAPDGTRVAIFAFNDQNEAKTLHLARFLTVIERGNDIDIAFDEAVLKVWHRASVTQMLKDHGYNPKEWWGDLRVGENYIESESPRLVGVAVKQ